MGLPKGMAVRELIVGVWVGLLLMVVVAATVPPHAIKGFTSVCESGAYVDADGIRRINFAKRTC